MAEHNPPQNAGYGFSGRMRPEFPSQVIIDVTESCNLACLHCPQEAFRTSDSFSGAMLDPALNVKAVDKVAAAGNGTLLDAAAAVRPVRAGRACSGHVQCLSPLPPG